MIELHNQYDRADVTALMFAMKECFDERDVDLVGPPELAKIFLIADEAARWLPAVVAQPYESWDGVVWYERLAEGALAEQLFIKCVLGSERSLPVVVEYARQQGWPMFVQWRENHGH